MHDQDPFEVLLGRLHPDPACAGERYERLRRTLLKFFELRRHADADVLADRTIDVVSRRMADGLSIASVELFALGVARHLDSDVRRSPRARQVSIADAGELSDPAGSPEAALSRAETERRRQREQTRMASRLQQLPADIRSLLIEYYRGSGRARIERRRRLAAGHGGNLNSLRIAICRIRAGLTLGLDSPPRFDRSEGDV
jgi:hypothetical protein